MLRAMSDLITSLHPPLAEEVSGLDLDDEILRGPLDLRYGMVSFQIDHEEEAEVVRVGVRLPPPVGAGPEFLIWLLAINEESRSAKFALDESGFLLVHLDLPADAEADVELLRDDVTDAIDQIAQLIDESLVTYLYDNSLGTPAQMERWGGEAE
jgi:hypothetical protein